MFKGNTILFLNIARNSFIVINHYNLSLFQVNIFFNSMDVKHITQTPKYSSGYEVLGNLGGALSLYLGISLLGVFEVVEFIIRCVVALIV